MDYFDVLAVSLEYVPVDVDVTVAGQAYDPTADAAMFTLVTPGSPAPALTAPSTWDAVAWETVGTGSYRALCLVGPGSVIGAKTAGTEWDCYIAVVDNPESPVKYAGKVRFH